jgi:hypothetical protein
MAPGGLLISIRADSMVAVRTAHRARRQSKTLPPEPAFIKGTVEQDEGSLAC